MSKIMKRVTVVAGGTPEYLGNLMTGRLPEGVPKTAVIVGAELKTWEESTLTGPSVVVSSSLELILEWPA